MSVCRFFMQGKCRFGDRCRFQHPETENNYDYYNSNRTEWNETRYNDENWGNSGDYWNNMRTQHTRYSYDGNYRPQRHTPFENQTHRSDFNSERKYRDADYELHDSHYPSNQHGRNKYEWVSNEYAQQRENHGNSFFNASYQKPRNDNFKKEPFFNTSTPKTKVSFSFKDEEREHPSDLYMNQENRVYAEVIKEEAIAWEKGSLWPFTCFGPFTDKFNFPDFIDLSPEELRLEAYTANENNTYDAYVSSTRDLMEKIKEKRKKLTEPSVELMTIINNFKKGKSLDTVDGNVPHQSQKVEDPKERPLDLYTPLEQLSADDKEQFEAPTFVLGKIPTLPPPQALCF